MQPERQGPDVDDQHRVGSRALLAATIAYALLSGVSLLLLGAPPAAGETPLQVVEWFHANRDAVRWTVWLMTVSTPVFAVMVALLRRTLPGAHRDVFFFGAIIYIASLAVFTWFWAGLTLHAGQLEPAIYRTVLDVAIFMGPVLTGATTTMIAPATLLALQRRSGFPLWLGILGLAAFLEQSLETITIFGRSGFTQPGGSMNLQLGAGLTFAWIIAFGIWGGLRGRIFGGDSR